MDLSALKIETSKLKGQIQRAPVNMRSCFFLSPSRDGAYQGTTG